MRETISSSIFLRFQILSWQTRVWKSFESERHQKQDTTRRNETNENRNVLWVKSMSVMIITTPSCALPFASSDSVAVGVTMRITNKHTHAHSNTHIFYCDHKASVKSRRVGGKKYRGSHRRWLVASGLAADRQISVFVSLTAAPHSAAARESDRQGRAQFPSSPSFPLPRKKKAYKNCGECSNLLRLPFMEKTLG